MKKVSVLLAALTWNLVTPAYSASPDFPHIETSGYGEVVTKPDMAVFSVQVIESALSAEQAKKAADEVVVKFVSRLTKAGVSRDDIQAANLHLAPRYHYPKSGESELVGYRATRRITVTTYNLEQLNTYLDEALGEGIKRVDNIQLKVKNRDKYQSLARLEAIRDANEKAKSLAEGFGGELHGVWKVSYHNNQGVQPVMMRAMNAKAESSMEYQDTSITIRDNVSVIYRFEQK
ncbi:oxidative stress defense protein [Vibrio sp. JC009]|uniref:oxidative stress defense protein n=1 Tax=Vibrio sp. JC009 TaxID=2912314 RepID=UPI0023AFF2C8|nr:oxidative stress defense protein [Vibrio sp. JC009]WED22225.1 oxidative stress defense protein [Vibrio sp. JC009]